jgi:acyl-coenzyme A synthetase/AMP-(fatty) acid ligase
MEHDMSNPAMARAMEADMRLRFFVSLVLTTPVESTYRMLEKYHITNLAAVPTAYRLLLAAGEEAARQIKGQLRVANSAGEPLNPEVSRWFEEHVGCDYHTVQSVRHPGSMGQLLSG